MKIQLKHVHIQNFRSIRDAIIELEPFSILFGKNDTGKSNLLSALKYAFSGGGINDDDVFLSLDYPFTREKPIIIDLMFVPIDEGQNRIKSFDDSWSMHFGDNISIDSDDNEFFAFRAKYSYDKEKEDYIWERQRIDMWDEKNIIAGNGIGFKTLSVFDYIFLDAQRDIALDIRNKNSLWNRQIAKLQMLEGVKVKIESSLKEIGNKIKLESPFLQDVEKDLADIINTNKSQIDVSPIARNINELYKGLDIYVAPDSSSNFSISNLGLGTRSKAVFSVLNTIIKRRMETSQSIPCFCILALEEPEAHIYPHSQRQLIQNFLKIEGQKIVTTHSPYLLTSLSIKSLIHVSLSNAESKYTSFSGLHLGKKETRKIDRFVLNTRGDILFSNVTILAEGETEEQSLSIFFEEYFHRTPFELGVNIVGVGGEGKKYFPFLQILEAVGISWFIFSDGEAKPIKDLQETMQELQGTKETIDLSKINNIIIASGQNYETHLIENGYKNELIMAINEFEDESKTEYFLPFFESYKERYLAKQKKDENAALLQCLKNGKTKYATIIAKTICKKNNGDRKFPPKIKELMEKVKWTIENKK
jgi:putative ATP-dependent endonuclease of OLD family